jgi:hypothetical protein
VAPGDNLIFSAEHPIWATRSDGAGAYDEAWKPAPARWWRLESAPGFWALQ